MCVCACQDYRAATVCLPAALPPLPMNWCTLEDKGLPSDAPCLSVCWPAQQQSLLRLQRESGEIATPVPVWHMRNLYIACQHQVFPSVPSCKQTPDTDFFFFFFYSFGYKTAAQEVLSHEKVKSSVGRFAR